MHFRDETTDASKKALMYILGERHKLAEYTNDWFFIVEIRLDRSLLRSDPMRCQKVDRHLLMSSTCGAMATTDRAPVSISCSHLHGNAVHGL